MTDVIIKLWPWALLVWLGAHILVAVMDRLADRREEQERRDAQEDLDDLREVFGKEQMEAEGGRDLRYSGGDW